MKKYLVRIMVVMGQMANAHDCVYGVEKEAQEMYKHICTEIDLGSAFIACLWDDGQMIIRAASIQSVVMMICDVPDAAEVIRPNFDKDVQ